METLIHGKILQDLSPEESSGSSGVEIFRYRNVGCVDAEFVAKSLKYRIKKEGLYGVTLCSTS